MSLLIPAQREGCGGGVYRANDRTEDRSVLLSVAVNRMARAPRVGMLDFPEELHRKVLSYVEERDSCTVLTIRLVSKTWCLLLPFVTTLETFSQNRLAIPFMFERYVFEPARSLHAEKVLRSYEMRANVSSIVYKFCTKGNGQKGNLDTNKMEREMHLYEYAFKARRILRDMFPDASPDSISRFLVVGFTFIDRFYCVREEKPLLADRMYEAIEA